MTWLNGALLGGLAMVVIPIVIHLSMRRKPKKMVFPALRFVQARSAANKRSLRVRRWILLALRCLAIACVVILLARPTVAAPLVGDWILIGTFAGLGLVVTVLFLTAWGTGRGWLVWAPLAIADLAVLGVAVWLILSVLTQGSDFEVGDARAPVSAVVICDTSPRMGYQFENRSVLSHAQLAARSLISDLPQDSQIAVVSSDRGSVFWSAGRSAALKTVDRLKTTGRPRVLTDTIRQALRLVDEARHDRKEIYVFSDLTRPSWPEEQSNSIEQLIDQKRNVTLFILDVGIEKPSNVWLGDLSLSTATIAGGGVIEIEVALLGTSQTSRTVELWLEDSDPSLPFVRDGQPVKPTEQLKDRVSLSVSPNRPARHTFYLGSLPAGTHHGRVKVIETDPLEVDDERFFSVVVQEPWRMLVVAGPQTSAPAWIEAVAPRELRDRHEAPFVVQECKPAELINTDLSQFDVVCLLDPPPLADDTWNRFSLWLENGNGLVVALGANVEDPANFASKAAGDVLGCVPTIVFRAKDTFLAPANYEHPMLRAFRPFADTVPWSDFRVARHWGIEKVDLAASTVLAFANRETALLEHRVGKGRVMVMTTPLTEFDRPKGRKSWNDLAGPNDWPRFILVNELAAYAVGSKDLRFNYFTGESVSLANMDRTLPTSYHLAKPSGAVQQVRASEGTLQLAAPEEIGQYRLKGSADTTVVRGFSANLSAAQSDLGRVDSAHLNFLLGESQYQLARDLDELEGQQGTQRSGREFYPFLVVLLTLLLGVEQMIANRFYGKPQRETVAPSLVPASAEAAN
jgi:hypothetical protein